MVNKLNNKFNVDLLWNMASFAGIAGIGILINILILKSYSSEALGVFNQVYALFILLSQLAVGGVHLSVQRYIPNFSENKTHNSLIIISSLIVAATSSIIVIGVCLIAKDLPGYLLNSDAVTTVFKYVVIGLLFFSFNKILLSFHNGCRRMKAFAVFQLLRFIFMLITLLFFIQNNIAFPYIALILVVSEVLLFLILLVYSFKFITLKLGKTKLLSWIKINYKFGNKALLGNFLLDVNTKVDIFILGIFLSDSVVGIYSFASTFAEGFMQLPVLFRNNINPILTKLSYKFNPALSENILNKSIKKFYLFIGGAGILSCVFFPVLFFVFDIKENTTTIWLIYSALVSGTIATAGYQPLLMIFNQYGLPSQQTLFTIFMFLSNVILNIALVPLIGIYGAAIATSISAVCQMYFQKYLIKKFVKISI